MSRTLHTACANRLAVDAALLPNAPISISLDQAITLNFDGFLYTFSIAIAGMLEASQHLFKKQIQSVAITSNTTTINNINTAGL